MTIIEIRGGPITRRYLMNKSKHDLASMYMDLLRFHEWKPITDEIKRPVLVTNNLSARDSRDQMSHLWVASFIQRSNNPEIEGEFICFDGWHKIERLSHYLEIPLPAPPDGEE